MSVVPAASETQRAAADPARSNWVGANAGSGKTHVLTQRVARLLLAGARPERILCLTYTKAAAAEMQNRLFGLLGGWAMASDGELAANLAAVEGGPPNRDPDRLARARRLFASALEAPGGLKIQTIHAFCDALLRRFPLEAGVSPRFAVLDDRQSALLLEGIRGSMAEDAEDGVDLAFDAAARRLNEEALDGLVRGILGRRDRIAPDAHDRIAAHFPSTAGRTREEVARLALDGLERDLMDGFAQGLAMHGGKVEQTIAAALRQIADTADPLRAVVAIIGTVLTQKGEPRRTGFPTKAVREQVPDGEGLAAELTDWAVHTSGWLRSVEMAARTADLHTFGLPLLQRYEAAKAARGLLDFDDLVERVRLLLTRADMAAWVLYKLDQGIDHILVDEAQDTSPRQWEVIARLLDEFYAGEGARAIHRTVFVVGDEKQSIYSFQGADPQAFGQMRARVAEGLTGCGEELGRPDLHVSFRSAPAILEFVDAVFAGENAEGLLVGTERVIHEAHRKRDQGRVDLWPLVEPEPNSDPPDWWEPIDAVRPEDPRERLARLTAGQIAELVSGARLPARDGVMGRLVTPGDILVLVSRRDRLARGIIRELKKNGVPVAGADRLSLAAELAVKDLLALARFAVDPADDLTLATLLRSPLCGLSEEDLFALAHGRVGSLWRAMRKSDLHAPSVAFLADMLGRSDYLRPYEFFERALGIHDGRRRLLARLGTEAEDPIDELLTQALAYERTAPPSLVGFLHWLEAADTQVKREMDTGAGVVRVMTVHGAKGLEAPIVILPDTMSRPSTGRGPSLVPVAEPGNAGELLLWLGARAEDDPVAAAARAVQERRQEDERRRLLYVALTRAEDWLILCGAGRSDRTDGTWYAQLDAAMSGLRTVQIDSPAGSARRFEAGASGTMPALAASRGPGASIEPLPEWLQAAPAEARPRRLSPSALGEDVSVGGAGMGREAARSYGRAVHALLERLGDVPGDTRAALARRLLAHDHADMTEHHQAIMAEVERVFAMPEAGTLFGPRSLGEVAVALSLDSPGLRPMIGRIDRTAWQEDALWLIDFKTDRRPPQAPSEVSVSYRAQLGAYLRALEILHPGAPIRPGLLWTAEARLMWLDAVDLRLSLDSEVSKALS